MHLIMINYIYNQLIALLFSNLIFLSKFFLDLSENNFHYNTT